MASNSVPPKNLRRPIAVAAKVIVLAVAVFLFAARFLQLNVAKLDFSENPDGVGAGIAKGWLPSWFPNFAYQIYGAQETFDNSFIWLTFRVPAGEDDFLEANCSAQDAESVKLPSAEYMQRFPSRVRRSYDQLLSQTVTFLSCPDSAREYFVAVDSSGTQIYLWSY